MVTFDGRVLEVGYDWVDGGPGFMLQDDDRLAELPLRVRDLSDTWEEHPLVDLISEAWAEATRQRNAGHPRLLPDGTMDGSGLGVEEAQQLANETGVPVNVDLADGGS